MHRILKQRRPCYCTPPLRKWMFSSSVWSWYDILSFKTSLILMMMSRWSEKYWPVKQTPLFPSLAGQSPFLNLTIWNTLRTETWKITLCIEFCEVSFLQNVFQFLDQHFLSYIFPVWTIRARQDLSLLLSLILGLPHAAPWAIHRQMSIDHISFFLLLWKQLYCEQKYSILSIFGWQLRGFRSLLVPTFQDLDL